MSDHTAPIDAPQYRKAYLRGWRTSARSADGALDRADDRNETAAWYDGYLDYAAGRDQWHMLYCRQGLVECTEHRWA